MLLGMLAAGMPAYFAMDHTRDREVTTNAARVQTTTLRLRCTAM